MKVILSLLVLLTGCAGVPYIEVGAGYRIDEHSDWFLRTERQWQCIEWTAHGEAGWEFPRNWKLGYHHQSLWFCGGPFNDKPELYENQIVFTKKFGGIQWK